MVVHAYNRCNLNIKEAGEDGTLFIIYLFIYFGFSRQGFSVTLEPVPELALVDQAGLKLTEICLPLPLECWD